jgi:hypothetical protein
MIILVGLFIIVIILLFVCLYILKLKGLNPELKMYQFNAEFTNLTHSDPINSPFSELGYKEAQIFKDANFVLFSDYIYIDYNLSKIPFFKETVIYGFNGMDQLANKGYLAKYMRDTNYIPKTYVLAEGEIPTIANIYFLKKNIQRQEGNLITKDMSYIQTKALSDGFVVAQELLQDVYLVNKRKINMRVYLLVVIEGDNIKWYLYKDGFIYYTPKYFEKNSIDKDVNITTGYIDRSVYIDNPLTHTDLYKIMEKDDVKRLKKNIHRLFVSVKQKYSDKLLELNKNILGLKVNILGVDVGPTSNLDVKLIEINKGPSLTYMDERDKSIKFNMVKNLMTLIGISKNGDPYMFETV